MSEQIESGAIPNVEGSDKGDDTARRTMDMGTSETQSWVQAGIAKSIGSYKDVQNKPNSDTPVMQPRKY